MAKATYGDELTQHVGGTILLEIFLQSLLIGYSGAIMPGPLITYTLDKSIRSGVRAGVLIITGHGILEIALIGCVVRVLHAYSFLPTILAFQILPSRHGCAFCTVW